MKNTIFAFLSVVFIFSLAQAETKTYIIDPDHSNVEFKIRHLFSSLSGRFTKFSGTYSIDPKSLKNGSVQVTIQTESIQTDQEKRDNHLRAKDFFWVKRFPKITFQSKEVKKINDNQLSIEGDLVIRDIKRPIILETKVMGFGKDPWGRMKSGFEARTVINRKDFELLWNEKLDQGGYLLGDEVSIFISIEGSEQEKSKP